MPRAMDALERPSFAGEGNDVAAKMSLAFLLGCELRF
jgi:hypothetical protein